MTVYNNGQSYFCIPYINDKGTKGYEYITDEGVAHYAAARHSQRMGVPVEIYVQTGSPSDPCVLAKIAKPDPAIFGPYYRSMRRRVIALRKAADAEAASNG